METAKIVDMQDMTLGNTKGHKNGNWIVIYRYRSGKSWILSHVFFLRKSEAETWMEEQR